MLNFLFYFVNHISYNHNPYLSILSDKIESSLVTCIIIVKPYIFTKPLHNFFLAKCGEKIIFDEHYCCGIAHSLRTSLFERKID